MANIDDRAFLERFMFLVLSAAVYGIGFESNGIIEIFNVEPIAI